jgi:hypothetical protein
MGALRTIALLLIICLGSWSARAVEGGAEEKKKSEDAPSSAPAVSWISVPSDDRAWAVGSVLESDKMVQIPEALVERIEKFYVSEMRRLEPISNSARSDKDILADMIRRYLRAVVRLDDDGSAALYRATEYESGRGGMVIDLKSVVGAKRANFRVEILLSATGRKREWIDGQDVNIAIKAFYVSNARERTLAGESYGAGCGSYMDVSTYFNRQMSRGGFRVNTTEQRYLTALAGTYVFATVYRGDLYLSSVTLTDSRFSQHLCREV